MSTLCISSKRVGRTLRLAPGCPWHLQVNGAYKLQNRHQSSPARGALKSQSLRPSQEKISGQNALPPLSVMPLRLLLRSYIITSFLASRPLMSICMPLMNGIAHSRSALLNPDRNPLLRILIKVSFYNHFAAGENDAEVRKTVATIRGMGFKGVILGYAKEHIADPSASREEAARSASGEIIGDNAIHVWRGGILRTLNMLEAGDFLAIKFTGAGPAVTEALAIGNTPPPAFWGVMQEICGEAIKRNIRIWIDAEQQIFQSAIDTWTTSLMRTYNRDGQAHIYTTFQAYLKSTPTRISQHLALASVENWVLGIKLVRGAYIASEPRNLIHDTKAETDAAYNSIVHALINQSSLAFSLKTPAKVQLFLASHNEESVRKAYALQRARLLAGKPIIKLEFGQLQGMSDEVSCRLLQIGQEETEGELRPKAFKCLNWGSTQECMQFLVRRAIENQGAMQRTRDWASGLRMELWRRVKPSQKKHL